MARLRYAYADALLEAGRAKDSLTWFHRTEAVDGEGITDAADRASGQRHIDFHGRIAA